MAGCVARVAMFIEPGWRVLIGCARGRVAGVGAAAAWLSLGLCAGACGERGPTAAAAGADVSGVGAGEAVVPEKVGPEAAIPGVEVSMDRIGPWVRVGDLSARTETEGAWLADAGGGARVGVGLAIRNEGSGPITVPLLDTVTVQWSGADGVWRDADSGRNATRAGETCVELAAGQTVVVDRSAGVLQGADGTFAVVGDDGFGGVWAIRGLEAGELDVRLRLRADAGAGGAWSGEIVTRAIRVRVGSRAGA